MALGREVEVPGHHYSRDTNSTRTAAGSSKWPDETMDEIELGRGEEGDVGSTGAAKGSSEDLATSNNMGTLVKMRTAFGLSNKADSLEWNIKDYSVKLRKGATRTILKNMVGRAHSGSFVAILGPSGSGKTSLIDCLALRNPDFSGALRLDDEPIKSTYFAHTGYVHQTEMFLNHLTCREHLTFHSINRMSYKYSRHQCLLRVDEVLEEVDLTKVGDSQIGGGSFYVTKGLSGGERKRLNIATELISDPSTIFLDEPTSGLDAVMGELVCLLLQQLACRSPSRIVMASLHTPSSKMFTMFSHLLILTSNGQLAYYGPRPQLLPFLSSLGFSCPPNYNPADFVLELASAKVVKANHQVSPGSVGGETKVAAGQELENVASSSVSTITTASGCVMVEAVLVSSEAHLQLVEACAAQLLGAYRRLDGDGSHQAMLGVTGGRSSMVTQFSTNLWRSWLQQSREVVGHSVGFVMNLVLGLLFGILYLNQVQGSWRNTAGLLFALVVTLLISSAIQVTLHMPGDFNLLLREYYTGCNSSVPYFLGRTLAAMPFSVIYMVTAIVPYFMTGLARDAAAFGWYCLICALIIFGSQSVGYLSSAFSSNPVVGLALLPVLITPMILFSGMLYERQSVRPYLVWIQDVSLVNYSFATLIMNEAHYAKNKLSSDLLLSFLQVHPRDWSVYMLLLFVLGVGYRLVAMLILAYRVRTVKPI